MKKGTRNGYWLDLGEMPYEPAFEIQERLAGARIRGDLPTMVIVQENDPVFTIGRTGSRSNILASDEDLDRLGIQVLSVNRGGDVTYHGPGQVIVSPLFYLGDIDLNANEYFHKLEDLLILALDGHGIEAKKKQGFPGAWCGDKKIAAIGIAVKHGYTFHGFSLNVNLDLSPFDLINPCGIQRMPVTSMKRILGGELPMAVVKQTLQQVMTQIFGFRFQNITRLELSSICSAA